PVGAKVEAAVCRQPRLVAVLRNEVAVALQGVIPGNRKVAAHAVFRTGAEAVREPVEQICVQRMPLVEVTPVALAGDDVGVAVLAERIRKPPGETLRRA